MISFAESAWEEYQRWAAEDQKVFAKINKLIKEITRAPLSRHVVAASCKYHY